MARFIACVASLLLSVSAFAQTPPSKHQPLPPRSDNWAPSPQEQYVAYWTLEPGWATSLEVRNNMRGHDLSVTPVLRMAGGQEISLPAVTLASEEVRALDLRIIAGSAAPQILDKNGSFGSVVFRFDANMAANMFAGAIVQRVASPIAFHFDGTTVSDSTDPGSAESIWWLPSFFQRLLDYQ